METAKKSMESRRGGSGQGTGREVSRLNLALPAETRDRLERLQEQTGASSLTETIANALRVFEWLAEQREHRRDILVREPGKEPYVVQFVL